MAVSIAEYLGQRVDVSTPKIIPSSLNPKNPPTCPFMGGQCSKLKGAQSHHPVCSVRTGEEFFVVCPDRVLPAKANVVTSDHIHLLQQLSQILFPNSQPEEVGYRRQTGIKLGEKRTVYLDYVLALQNPSPNVISKAIVEIQAGGETSSTGSISRKVEDWANSTSRSNEILGATIPKVGVIPNNAWKRQLEQIFRKLPYAQHFEGSFCLVVGTVLYDYILSNAPGGTEYSSNWELAFVEVREDQAMPATRGAVPLEIGRSRFLTFQDFVQALQSHALPDRIKSPFVGSYETLTNSSFTL